MSESFLKFLITPLKEDQIFYLQEKDGGPGGNLKTVHMHGFFEPTAIGFLCLVTYVKARRLQPKILRLCLPS